MAGEEGGGVRGDEAGDGSIGLKEALLGEWRSIKVSAETYPYVWGSYILVYAGLTGIVAITFRRVRRKEDNIRALLARLHKVARPEETQAGSSTPPPPDKSSGSS